MWSHFQAENDTTATCIICKKGVKYSGNTTDLFKHMSSHVEENEKLKDTQRGEKSPNP